MTSMPLSAFWVKSESRRGLLFFFFHVNGFPPVAGYIPGCCGRSSSSFSNSAPSSAKGCWARRREHQCFAQMDQSLRPRNGSNRPRRRGCLLLRILLQYCNAVSTSHRRLQPLNNYYKHRQFKIVVEGGNDIIFTTVLGSPS